jgi:23S rRNA pseudouridine1911/1915/1917 synthase
VYLAAVYPEYSRSSWQKYIKAGCIRIDGHVVTSPGAEVDETAVIDVIFPEASNVVHDVAILYEDEDVVVINKPSGMLTHAKGGIVDEQTVADTAKRYVSGLDGERAGIVHRLDRDTSGVLIIARNEKSMKHLQQQFAGRSVAKTYIAAVDGTPKLPEAMIDLPIGRNPTKPSTFRVDAKGKPAQTHYRVLASDGTRSLVELKPTTGRTHQLRVHMGYIGTPIRGDVVYGTPAERLMLHAHTLTVTLPSGETRTFTASLPELFTQQAKELGYDG